jgi:hypothetical protein
LPKKRIAIIKFLEKVRLSENTFFEGTPCWEWSGSLFPKTGYGQFGYPEGNTGIAHRASYMIFIGDIPGGQEIDHGCNNRRCVSPLHLQTMRHVDNIKRKYANKTKGGHNDHAH